MSKLAIRKATPMDAPTLTKCIDSAYLVYQDIIPDLPNVAEGLSLAILNKSVWVAELEGEVVGGIVLDPNEAYLTLENVAVNPQASGAGVGKALITQAEAECLRLGLSDIRLSTHKAMKANIGLYEHLGWAIVDVDGNKVHMAKSV